MIKHVKEMAEILPKDYILGLRLHPMWPGRTKLHINNVSNLSDEKSLSIYNGFRYVDNRLFVNNI